MAYTYYYSSLALSLSLSVGNSEDESFQNFRDWCDSLAMMFSGDHCLLTDLGGNRMYGLFHQMREGEHDAFEAHLSRFVTWAAQCDAGNLSAGKYSAIAPSGRGTLLITHKKLGPFQ